jgi:hypothetical protein
MLADDWGDRSDVRSLPVDGGCPGKEGKEIIERKNVKLGRRIKSGKIRRVSSGFLGDAEPHHGSCSRN